MKNDQLATLPKINPRSKSTTRKENGHRFSDEKGGGRFNISVHFKGSMGRVNSCKEKRGGASTTGPLHASPTRGKSEPARIEEA